TRLEPPCFGARVQERDAIAVFGETRDPGAHFESIERRIEIDESLTRPRVIQAAGRPARVRARPRTWICSRRVEIEVSKRVENPAWCDMILGIADTAFVRTNSHDALPVNASAEAK